MSPSDPQIIDDMSGKWKVSPGKVAGVTVRELIDPSVAFLEQVSVPPSDTIRQTRQESYPALHDLVMALWAHAHGDSTLLNEVEALRQQVKQKYPYPVKTRVEDESKDDATPWWKRLFNKR